MLQTLRRLTLTALLLLVAFAALVAQQTLKLPPGVQKITSVEGITEYSLPNGLRVLLFPDPSKPIMTVNITYKVGSRHENYGETGMAHLLEHLVFKGTPISRRSSPNAEPDPTVQPGSTAPITSKHSTPPRTTSAGRSTSKAIV
jgi:zinc protease